MVSAAKCKATLSSVEVKTIMETPSIITVLNKVSDTLDRSVPNWSVLTRPQIIECSESGEYALYLLDFELKKIASNPQQASVDYNSLDEKSKELLKKLSVTAEKQAIEAANNNVNAMPNLLAYLLQKRFGDHSQFKTAAVKSQAGKISWISTFNSAVINKKGELVNDGISALISNGFKVMDLPLSNLNTAANKDKHGLSQTVCISNKMESALQRSISVELLEQRLNEISPSVKPKIDQRPLKAPSL